jgi:methionine synthase I (cobalamin-dependent)
MTNSAQPAQLAQPGRGLVFGERVLAADGAMGTMFQASDECVRAVLGLSVRLTEALIAFHPEARYFSA